ncbi:MAG TPA: hypothetical protein PLH98_05340 [Ruminococcus flavefaciens]|nr:hypothetical protein [Ruminococcus flavefaciens]
MILNKKKYRCPYCGGRLFDYICYYRDPLSDIGPIGCYPAIRIKCWKCRMKVKITYEDLV